MDPRQQLATRPARVQARDVISDKWFLRLDGPKEDLRKKCEELGSFQDYILQLAVYHVGSKKENPHMHMIFQMNQQMKKQALSVRIKSIFGCKGTQYSLNAWDGEPNGAGSYLWHEDNEADPLYVKGVSKEYIDECRNYATEWRRVVVSNQAKASNKLVDKALDYFQDKKPTERDVFTYLMKCCADGENHYPGLFRIKTFTEECMLKLNKHNWSEYIDRMYDRAFR